MKIINIFDGKEKEEQDFALGEDDDEDLSVGTPEQGTAVEEKQPDDIEGYFWISSDGCVECQQYNNEFFSPEELPIAHPNCRCMAEVVLKSELKPDNKIENEPEVSEKVVIKEEKVPEKVIKKEEEKPEKELSEAEKKKCDDEIYRRNLKDLEHFEGKKDFIYLDSDGNITTGIGTNVSNKEIFVKVKFEDQNGRLLSEKEKEALYAKIQKDKKQIKSFKGKTANYYRGKWTATVNDKEIINLVKGRIEADIKDLREICEAHGKDFDKLPPSQQDALLDMRYNMGRNFNAKKWPSFYEALEEDNYDEMGTESHRDTPVPEERNEWTEKKFAKAKTEARKKKEE